MKDNKFGNTTPNLRRKYRRPTRLDRQSDQMAKAIRNGYYSYWGLA